MSNHFGAKVIDDEKSQTDGEKTPTPSQHTPIVVSSPSDAYAPTVPTTPTSTDTGNGAVTVALPSPNRAKFQAIAPPSFELIPRPHLSPEEAAEKRIRALLERERAQREEDGLQSVPTRAASHRDEDEEDFWTADEERGENSAKASSQITARASVTMCVDLGIDDTLLVEVIEWLLEVRELGDETSDESDPDYMRAGHAGRRP